MLHLARFSTRRPFLAFAAWFAVAAILAAIGLGVSHSLSPTIVVVPGSETARAEQLAESNFGPSVLVPIMLEGPKAQLNTQGPALVKALAARRDTRVLSAWDIGDTGAALRPDATHAMIVASVAQTEKAMVDGVQQDINGIVDQTVTAPVKPYITGTPTIDLATKDQSLDATRRAELLALPILFLVLLLILRAPVAALVLTAFGGATTLMSFGAMAAARQGHRRRPDRGGARLDGRPRARRQLRDAGLPALALRACRAGRARPCGRGARRRPRDRDHRPRGAHRRHGAGRGPRPDAADRPEHDPHLPGHRRDAVLGARDRRRRRRHAGPDDDPRTPDAGVLVRRPALRDGAVEPPRRSWRRLGHPQRDRRRSARDRAARGPRHPGDEPQDGARLSGAAAEGRRRPRVLRQDLGGHGTGVHHPVQHRRGLARQADHRPRDAARDRCLPGQDRHRQAREVGRRPG